MIEKYIKPYTPVKQITVRRVLDFMTNEDKQKEKALKSNENIGIRQQVLRAYQIKKDINDAIAVINDINNKIGKQAYTEEMIRVWIQEYENKNKSRNDDDDAR